MDYGEWKLYVAPAHQEVNTAVWFALIGFFVAMLGKAPEDVPLDEMLKYLVPAMSAMLQSAQEVASE